MRLLDYFRTTRHDSASQAKDRLQIIIAHDRLEGSDVPDYLPEMKREILEVIRKYVPIELDQVKFNLDKEDDYEVLALNIVLPEKQ